MRLASLPPDLIFVGAVIGILLVYWELCSPGRVAPGSVGSVLALGGIWLLGHNHPQPSGFAVLAVLVLILMLEWVSGANKMFEGLAIGLSAAVPVMLFRGATALTWWLAAPVGLVLGAITVFLMRTARLARRRKQQREDEGEAA